MAALTKRVLDRLERPGGESFDRFLFCLSLGLRGSFLIVWLWKGWGAVFERDLYYDLAMAWLGWGMWTGPDMTHPPLYTGFIAAIQGFAGFPNPWPVLVIQTILSSISPVLVHWIGKRLADERTARLGALWAAVEPTLIFFTPHLQTETLFVFMELVFFAGLYALIQQPKAKQRFFYLLGFWGGLASLCRSVFAAYPAVLLPILFYTRGRRKALVPALLFSAGWLSPVAVWTARNWAVYREIVPISAQMGWTLYEGFTLDRDEIRRRPFEMAAEAERLGINTPILAGRHFKAKTLELVRQDPLGAAKIVLGKAALYWRPWLYDPYTRTQRALLGSYFVVLFALAIIGVLRTRADPLWFPVFGLFLYLTIMHAFFFTSIRYRIPLAPFLCLLGARGLLAAGLKKR